MGAVLSRPLFDYQIRALSEVSAHVANGTRRVCLVAPPGAGKTRMGVELPRLLNRPKTLWLAHRKELIRQAADELAAEGYDVGLISPDYAPDPYAPIQVASIDTLVEREHRPDADLLIPDECHHLPAASYREVARDYPAAIHVGLTATPQRQDGKPLGDLFDELVIAAQYSALLAAGRLVPCRVFRPDEYLGSDLARDPLDAWLKLAQNQPTFAFAPDIKRARMWAEQFSSAGVPSVAVDQKTPKADRTEALSLLREGALKVLWNVYVFTEGTNVPEASVCLLSRGVGHAGPYLQITGRVLRAAPGKVTATLIDLAGDSHLHGLPTQDREYALDGRAIRAVGEPLKNCPQCGLTLPVAATECECGYVFAQKPRAAPKIWDFELREAVAAAGDPMLVSEDHKLREWRRLRAVCRSRGWGLWWAVKQFRGQGLGEPPIHDCDEKDQVRELALLIALARDRGYRPGFAKVRFKELFGAWPRADMLMAAEAWHG
jgi:DNA repair protein RadD